jgi:hypothetical protein
LKFAAPAWENPGVCEVVDNSTKSAVQALPEIQACNVRVYAVSNIGHIESHRNDIDGQSVEHIRGGRVERKGGCLFAGLLAAADDIFNNVDGIDSIGVRKRILPK